MDVFITCRHVEVTVEKNKKQEVEPFGCFRGGRLKIHFLEVEYAWKHLFIIRRVKDPAQI